LPTCVPSSQPTGEPSASPTREATIVSYANGTSFKISKNGLHFASERTFDKLGLVKRQTFLSAYVWDTGFGPSTGQYVEFFVGGLPGTKLVPVINNNGTAVHCAPRKVGQPSCARQDWSACFYNFDVTGVLSSLNGRFAAWYSHAFLFHYIIAVRHGVLTILILFVVTFRVIFFVTGGTLTIYAESNGVLASTCPHFDRSTGKRDVVFIRYDISVDSIPTPAPTAAPTITGTKAASQNIYSGLSIDVGEMGYAFALQMMALAFLVFAAIGIAITRTTEHERCESHQHKMVKAVIEWGLVGADTVNFAFVTIQLYSMNFKAYTLSLLGVRMVNALVAFYLLTGVYGSKGHQNTTTYANNLDRKHLLLGMHAKLYAVTSFVVLLEVQLIAFLPWLNSPFTRMSMGFPNFSVYRIVSIETILGSLATISLQIPFLIARTGNPLTRGFSWINIGISCMKLFLAIITHFLKTSSLVDASTEHDLVDLKQWAHLENTSGMLDVSGAENGVPGINYIANPLHGLGRDKNLTEKDGASGARNHLGPAKDPSAIVNPLHEPSDTDGDVTTDGEDSEYALEKSDTEDAVEFTSRPIRQTGIMSKRGSVALPRQAGGIQSKRSGSIGPFTTEGALDLSAAVRRMSLLVPPDATDIAPSTAMSQETRRYSLGINPIRRDTIPESALIEAAKLVLASATLLPTMDEETPTDHHEEGDPVEKAEVANETADGSFRKDPHHVEAASSDGAIFHRHDEDHCQEEETNYYEEANPHHVEAASSDGAIFHRHDEDHYYEEANPHHVEAASSDGAMVSGSQPASCRSSQQRRSYGPSS
jgi:hypothetical protein